MTVRPGLWGLFFIFLGVSAFSQTPGTGAADSGTGGTPLSAAQNYRIGRDLEARNRLAEAEAYYSEAIRMCQNEVSRNAATGDTYTVITWTFQRQGKYADVIAWGERGLRVFPDEYRIIETMGEAYFYLNEYDRSLNFMQRYANVLPQGERISVAYFFIGEIFRLRQRFRHADIAYTTAVRFEPGLALWWYRLATVRESAGDKNPAIEAYERALRLNPGYQEASAGLARVRAQ
jgi:tetratricopeptide (TPR) repeat protein